MTSKYRCSNVRERQALIDRHTGLITCAARQLSKTGADMDELTAVGAIGLIKAANTFKPVRHCDFTTYSLRCIVREMVLYLHNKGRVSLGQDTYAALMNCMRAEEAQCDRAAAEPGAAGDVHDPSGVDMERD